MQITEPVTMLTDYALGAASLSFALLLFQSFGPRNRVSAWLWCAAFKAAAIAAFVGGTYHGFALELDPSILRRLWNVTLYSMGAATAFMVAGVHAAYIQREDATLKWITAGVLVTLLGLAVQQSGFRHHAHFNHNDIYHIIQMIAFYLLFRGARLLQDRHTVKM